MNATTKPKQVAKLAIEGEMNIYRAGELKEALLSALTGATSLEIDLHDVSEMDSAGIQLLMLTKSTGQALDCEVRLVHHSPAVLEVFELLDLAAHFGDPLLVPA